MKRLPYIAMAVVLLLLGWLVLRPTGPKEPSYQGRRLSEWINDYADSKNNPQKFPGPAGSSARYKGNWHECDSDPAELVGCHELSDGTQGKRVA